MVLDFLLQVWTDNHDREAIIWRDEAYTYGWLIERFGDWKRTLENEKIARTSVTVLEADFSPNAVALFFALLDHSCILVPLTASVKAKRDEFVSIAQGRCCGSAPRGWPG